MAEDERGGGSGGTYVEESFQRDTSYIPDRITAGGGPWPVEGGRYRLVVAHRNPGVPNWLDTEGRPHGHMYWRYLFPTTAPGNPKTKVVKVDSLA